MKHISKCGKIMTAMCAAAISVTAASVTAFAAEPPIDKANFPDDIFRNYVLEEIDKDDSETLSDEEISNCTDIDVNDMGITNLKGIEYFTYLKTLHCYNNLLTELDVSSNTELTELWCANNQLTELDVSNNTKLTYLSCVVNKLTELDVSNNKALTFLTCSVNQLTKLDVSRNTELTILDCYGNELTELDVSRNTELTILECRNNQLTTLDVSNNTKLIQLYCSDNQLTKLDVSNNTALTSLNCYNNQLTELDLTGCTSLKELICHCNFIQKKSDIKGLYENSYLRCDYNPQYYKDYAYYYTDANIQLYTDKVIVNFRRNISFHLSGFGTTEGRPGEDVINNSEGIRFTTTIYSNDKFTCDSPDVYIDNMGFITISKPGTYTIHFCRKDGMAKGVDFEKDLTITALTMEEHIAQGHEYDRYSPVYDDQYNSPGHARTCFCGAHSETEPHEFDESPNQGIGLDGKVYNAYHCTICHYSYSEESELLTDDETKISVTAIDEDAIDPDAVLNVDILPVTDIPEDLGEAKYVYDITLTKDGTEIQPDGKVMVTLPIPPNADGSKMKVYRKETDGSYTDMKAEFASGSNMLRAVTDHLGVYVVTDNSDILRGDMSGDGKVDENDILPLKTALSATDAEYDPKGDVNGDYYFDIRDLSALCYIVYVK